ncbi:probable methyltransferase PMT24 [Typha angustifolia]|uniref:probable methyltransferase PMT24 n=1 Tax=Typha angustifolia TaxID=59011 RepID=UPI003C2C017D
MALFGRSPRMDSRRSSSYCSTVTLVVFVALCLIGVWMMTSSSVVPVDMSSSENKSEMKQEVSMIDSRIPEYRPTDMSNNALQEEANTNMNDSPNENGSVSIDENNVLGKMVENPVEMTEEEKPTKPTDDTKDESFNTSKNLTFDDENGKTEGGELIKEDGENARTQEDVQDKSMAENLEEPTKEKFEQNADEAENDEKMKNLDKISSETKGGGLQESAGEKMSMRQEKLNGNELEERDDHGNQEKDVEQNLGETGNGNQTKDQMVTEVFFLDAAQSELLNETETGNGNQNKDQMATEVFFLDAAQSELLSETKTQNGAWSTQYAESKNEKELTKSQDKGYSWKLCNVTAGADYIPCLDNEEALKKLRTTKHYEHRERHCPGEAPTCLVPLPEGYKQPITWPNSKDKIWYHNVPHTKLADVKGHQNWVKVSGEYLSFPGGGTQFKHGALHYIDFIQQSFPDIAWGKRSRVVLDVGCGVASFGGSLFDRDVLTMSFAPKDEHEAQVQFALERGIPAISAVMGTKRLPFPSRAFDVVHCARCRVPWHIEGGMLLLELNRLLRPGGYFVWSATPVYQKLDEDVEIWQAMSELTKSICWDMVNKTKDSLNQVGLAIFRKPSNNECYDKRMENNPPFCQESDDPNAAWNISLQACLHRMPVDATLRGSQWPEEWPQRLEEPPYWLNNSQVGVYGKPALEDFKVDYEHWKHVVSKSYLDGMGINWSRVRNVMDMRSVYGGFAAALRDMKVWVMNIVSIDSPDTLPVIYERGLFGIYHDWCESFSTYPRTYDLLHADHLLSKIKKRCSIVPVIAEVDRVLRPEGYLIVRDNVETVNEVESIARSLNWDIRMTFSKEDEGLLCVQKTLWRPK